MGGEPALGPGGVLTPARILVGRGAELRPRAAVYWGDLAATSLVGWLAFTLALGHPLGSAAHLFLTAAAVLALLRGAMFLHELAHHVGDALPGFELAWHVLIGLPLMTPSLTYVGSHADHHRRSTFGTAADPEYLPLARRGRWALVRFVLGAGLGALALPLRWGVLAPLSALSPALRRLLVERASTLAINPAYRRRAPRGAEARRWALQQAAACALFWAALAAAAAGVLPARALGQWLLVSAGVLLVNQVRTLAAHGYDGDGEATDAEGQLLDSTNLRGLSVATALVAPLGLRFHALHHLVPSVPYHSLGRIHRRLTAELPAASAYRKAERRGLLRAVLALWRRAGRHGAAGRETSREAQSASTDAMQATLTMSSGLHPRERSM